MPKKIGEFLKIEARFARNVECDLLVILKHCAQCYKWVIEKNQRMFWPVAFILLAEICTLAHFSHIVGIQWTTFCLRNYSRSLSLNPLTLWAEQQQQQEKVRGKKTDSRSLNYSVWTGKRLLPSGPKVCSLVNHYVAPPAVTPLSLFVSMENWKKSKKIRRAKRAVRRKPRWRSELFENYSKCRIWIFYVRLFHRFLSY